MRPAWSTLRDPVLRNKKQPKNTKQQFFKKGRFWLSWRFQPTVGWLRCLWACGKAACNCRSTRQSKATLILWPGRERQEKQRSQNPLRGHAPNDLKLYKSPNLKGSTTPNSAKLGTKPLIHRPLGDISDPNWSTYNRMLHNNEK